MSKKILKGTVVSNKMNKAVVVNVEVPKRHPIYAKSIRNTKKLKAYDAIGTKPGDIVRIEESTPYSKDICWKVIELVNLEKEKK